MPAAEANSERTFWQDEDQLQNDKPELEASKLDKVPLENAYMGSHSSDSNKNSATCQGAQPGNSTQKANVLQLEKAVKLDIFSRPEGVPAKNLLAGLSLARKQKSTSGLPRQSDSERTAQQKALPSKNKPQVKSKGKRRRRPLPPGQRLVRAGAVASMLVVLQSFFNPLTGPCENITAGASPLVPIAAPFSMTAELGDLKQQIEAMCQVKKLTPGIFAIDPKTGNYVDFNGTRNFAAASMIKVPVLVALFSAIDRGDIDPKIILEIKPEHVAGGSGYLQYRGVGTKLPLMQVAELMIIISDNTATNMIIDLLGGKKAVNKKFANWGLKNTAINNWLADLEGTNRTSPYDLVYLLARVERGDLMSDAWRKKMRQIMERTKTRTLLPQGLPAGAKIAHKTGDIGSMVGDTGVITTSDGKKYIVAVQVQRPHNDRRANELIRRLSAVIYPAFASQAKPPAKPPVPGSSGPAASGVSLEPSSPLVNQSSLGVDKASPAEAPAPAPAPGHTAETVPPPAPGSGL